MRLRPALSTLACLLFLSTAAAADVFVIPLPAAGTYGEPPQYSTSRTMTFQLPGKPLAVHGVSLHLAGTQVIGTLLCDDPTPSEQPWGTAAFGEMVPGVHQVWSAEAPMPADSGPFAWTAPFVAVQYPGDPPVTWDFLAGGTGSIMIFGGPGLTLLGCYPGSAPPTVTITDAWLVVDADIPVPAHATSWGLVKAIYR